MQIPKDVREAGSARVVVITDDDGRGDDFAADVRRGLTSTPKQLPPKYFYDELGSALFAAICALPEYYVSRAETEIFRSHAVDIARAFGTPVRLIELGAGNARKTRILMEAMLDAQADLEYVPVDIDNSVLTSTAHELAESYPTLHIVGVATDFRDIDRKLAAIVHGDRDLRNVVLFLGSTIGNLNPAESEETLSSIRRLLRPGDALFLGTDLKKSKSVLEPAYDDPIGVTAAFNLNLLGRMNRELDANFDIRAFRHRAFYNESDGRIEMHVVSETAQSVRVGALDLTVDFAEGETIHTENSYKYDEPMITALAARVGFAVEQRWTDSRGWFADSLLVAI